MQAKCSFSVVREDQGEVIHRRNEGFFYKSPSMVKIKSNFSLAVKILLGKLKHWFGVTTEQIFSELVARPDFSHFSLISSRRSQSLELWSSHFPSLCIHCSQDASFRSNPDQNIEIRTLKWPNSVNGKVHLVKNPLEKLSPLWLWIASDFPKPVWFLHIRPLLNNILNLPFVSNAKCVLS